MPKRTLILITGLILITIILLAIAIRLSTQPTQPPPPIPDEQTLTPTPTPPAFTTLMFSQKSITVAQDGRGIVDVLVDTKGRNVLTGIQLEIAYDPLAISNITISPGTFFQSPIIPWETIDQATGRISYAMVLPPAQDGVTGQGTVATISFSRVPGTTLSQTSLKFLPKTAVTQAGISSSVLKSTDNLTIYLQPQSQRSVQIFSEPSPTSIQ